ncbi:MAG TPA: hypothetical protein VEY91_08195 [Candidatus Limnocylindria bacterium]|nr:hypothetical protein [Candidatus Limnocylindria bacterium]
MAIRTASRIEPSHEILAATRHWLEAARGALGSEFLACYLTGSVLTQGFDPKRSHVNVLLVSRALGPDVLDALARAIPDTRKPPHFDPLFMTQRQIEKSLDTFPVEWLEIQEAHLLIEGQDVLAALEVPPTYLRLQCEHELRGKFIQLRQAYIARAKHPDQLEPVLRASASSFATLFRTLLRLNGEDPPADAPHVIERIADIYRLDAEALIGAYLVRYTERRYTGADLIDLYRKFLVEVERLVTAIDEMRVP